MQALQSIRKPAVAGAFYPGEQEKLSALVDKLLAQSRDSEACPKVIIAPHAGYIYSGLVAARAYSRLLNRQHKISRVVLLGPAHRVGFQGIAASSAQFFLTPLGKIPLAQEVIKTLINRKLVTYLDQAHAEEHSLEVQLPFLQRSLDNFELIPLVVGNADKLSVARVLQTLWGDEETLIVISSDLSHYHEYAEAQQLDRQTATKILAMDDNLNGQEACGCKPLNGLLHLAAKNKMQVDQLMLLNSGDTAGPKNRVVGYGAFVINNIS